MGATYLTLLALHILLSLSGPAVDLQAILDAAQPGDVIRLPAGTYPGNFIVSKRVWLLGMDGPDGEPAVLDGRGEGTILTIYAAGTRVENLVIRSSGTVIDREDGGIVVETAANVQILNNRLKDVLYGIRSIESHGLVVRGNHISGKDLDVARRGDGLRIWQSEGCLVEENTVEGVRDAIFWFSDNTVIRRNTFQGSRYGIHMMYTDGMQVRDNALQGNSVGAYLMYSTNVRLQGNTFRQNRGPSGYGVALKDMDAVTVLDNYFFDNRVGLFFDNSPSRIDITQEIRRNVMAYNDIGVLMMPAVKRNVLRDNTFMDNLEQVGVKGGGSNPGDELGGNRWDGNFWSDYVGYDAATSDGPADGVGDLAYRSERLFENLADRFPLLQIFHFSPVEQAVNLAAQAFPVIKPKPKLTDAIPRMVPVLPAATPVTPQPDSGLGRLAVLLLLAASALLTAQFVTFRLPEGGAGAVSPSTGRTAGRSDRPMIAVKNLTKSYPRPGRAWWSDATITAVDDLSFELAAGGSLALWGENGAGKTTVLKCLLGLLRCRGDLYLDGLDLGRDGRAARFRLGYVPQELSFHNDLTVAESCRFYARLKKVSGERIPAVLAQVGLLGQERKSVGALSGGMKQRLALALALLADPPVLLLDEPTSNLDAATREEFVGLLNQLRRAGKTLLFTSHHRQEVEALAEEVLILRDGRAIGRGAPALLLDGPPAPVSPGDNGATVQKPGSPAHPVPQRWDGLPEPDAVA